MPKLDEPQTSRPFVTSAADSSVETPEFGQQQPPQLPTKKAGWLADTHRWATVQFLFFVLQLGLDLVAIVGGFLIAYWLRRNFELGGQFVDFNPSNYQLILIFSTSAVLLAFHNRKLYSLKRGYSKIDEIYRICAATFLGLVLGVFLNSFVLGPSFLYSRIILIYSFVLIIGLTFIVRGIFSYLVALFRRLGIAPIRIVIIGDGEPTIRILRKVRETPELGYVALGIVCEDDCGSLENAPFLGRMKDLTQIVKQTQADEVIVTLSGVTQAQLLHIVDCCADLPVNIRIYPEAFQLIMANEVSINALTGLPLLSVKNVGLRGVNRVIKRGMDIVISSLILIAASPIMLLLALLIKLTDRHGPVFYTQERVGLDGVPFTVLKFRSMKVSSEVGGPGWTTENDPRRTRLGTFIRRYSLDEIPQFVNVLIGDMSIVGPRPEQPKFVEQFSQTIPRYMRRHKEKAGITGWAQVNGMRGDTSIAERTRYDLYYVENWSVLFDLKIMLKTITVVFTDKNAY